MHSSTCIHSSISAFPFPSTKNNHPAAKILRPIPLGRVFFYNSIYPSCLLCNHFSAAAVSKSWHLAVPSFRLSTRFVPRASSRAVENGGGSGDEEELRVAREVVVEILEQSGLSEEESVGVAERCPAYVKMLVGSVRELDELALWNFRGIEEGGSEPKADSFRNKVWFIAKEKGDNGLIPFLESIGLSPSSSAYIARYLSSSTTTLVELSDKVKHWKNILFSGSELNKLVARNARRMLKYLSVSAIDEDIQRTVSFFEKMEARRGGIDMLDMKDASFPYLLESFPRLLLLSLDSDVAPLMDFLAIVGVPKGLERKVLLLFPPLIFYSIKKDVEPRIKFMKKAGIEGQHIAKVLMKYPWILSGSILENYGELVSFFSEWASKEDIDCAIRRWPHILGCSTSKLQLVVSQLLEFGIKEKRLGHIISACPQSLTRKPEELLEVFEFMDDIGLDEVQIAGVLSRCPEILTTSIKRTLKKKMRFIFELGISEGHNPRVIRKYPEVFVCDVNTLQQRVEYMLEMGLSGVEVSSMIYRFSPLLGYSIDKVLKPKFDFLFYVMKKPIKEVVEYPRYFSYSLEKKIKPRFAVLVGRNIQCSLREMLAKNDEDFAAQYLGMGRLPVPLARYEDSNIDEDKS